MPLKTECLFCRIGKGELSADVVWENNEITAFRDIHPKAPIHILVIPKKHIPDLAEIKEDDSPLIGNLFLAVKAVAEKLGISENGWRTIINTRSHGGQEIDHLHIHILAGEPIGPMRS
jgi:histidine triad (HIT) family protein